MHRIIVEEFVTTQVNGVGDITEGHTAVKRYEQTVEALDLSRLIAAINTKPRKRRKDAKGDGK